MASDRRPTSRVYGPWSHSSAIHKKCVTCQSTYAKLFPTFFPLQMKHFADLRKKLTSIRSLLCNIRSLAASAICFLWLVVDSTWGGHGQTGRYPSCSVGRRKKKTLFFFFFFFFFLRTRGGGGGMGFAGLVGKGGPAGWPDPHTHTYLSRFFVCYLSL